MLVRFAFTVIISMICQHVIASEFCAGFDAGYMTGYAKATGARIYPVIPICPIQPINGFGDPASDFEHGYVVGYQAGGEGGFDREHKRQVKRMGEMGELWR